MPEWVPKLRRYQNGPRKNAHSDKATITKMLRHLVRQGDAFNDVERALNDAIARKGINATYQQMKDEKFLSSGGFSGKRITVHTLAVCHKVPYGRFETALVKVMNIQLDRRYGILERNRAASALAGFLNHLGGSGYAAMYSAMVDPLISFVRRKLTSDACAKANEILLLFDGSPDNLFFGFQRTNASISDRGDLHFNVLDGSVDVATATPRGIELLKDLNLLEGYLGLPLTETVEVIEEEGSNLLTWTKSSGLDNKGFVLTDIE